MVFWFVAFLAVYFGGQAASDPNIGALIYIWFCIGGGIITALAWVFVVESESCNLIPLKNRGHEANMPTFLFSQGPHARGDRLTVGR